MSSAQQSYMFWRSRSLSVLMQMTCLEKYFHHSDGAFLPSWTLECVSNLKECPGEGQKTSME